MSSPKTPNLTVDSLTLDAEGRLLLIRRGRPPFEGDWALPGGFVELGETTEEACVRETLEETGVQVEIESLFGVFSKIGRDPRGHTVSVAYRCRPRGGIARGGDDAADARWFTRAEIGELSFAFDHGDIVAGFLRKA